MRFSGILYRVERGVLHNEKAYRVEPMGTVESHKFVRHLKKTVEDEYGRGMSLNKIITTTSGQVVFHYKKDYTYYMKKAKESWIEKHNK